MENCPICGAALTKEMAETGCCFCCGEDLPPHLVQKVMQKARADQQAKEITTREVQKNGLKQLKAEIMVNILNTKF